jgi:hypothetical protein
MSIAMSLSHVKTTTTTSPKQGRPASSDNEEDVTEFSFKRSISYEKVGDNNRLSHYQKSWERKEKKVNDASRSAAARIRSGSPFEFALQPVQQQLQQAERHVDRIHQQLQQQEKSNTGFDLLSAESKWTEIVENMMEKEEKILPAAAAAKGKDIQQQEDEEDEPSSWTVTAKKTIEYSRG